MIRSQKYNQCFSAVIILIVVVLTIVGYIFLKPKGEPTITQVTKGTLQVKATSTGYSYPNTKESTIKIYKGYDLISTSKIYFANVTNIDLPPGTYAIYGEGDYPQTPVGIQEGCMGGCTRSNLPQQVTITAGKISPLDIKISFPAPGSW